MPTKQHHVILRSRIEVTLENHSQHKLVQHTLHKVIQKRLLPILSKIFSDYVPSDVVIYLDKLVIDGGNVNLSLLSKQLPPQIEHSLTLELKEAINKVIHNPKANQVIPLPDAKREAIAHYLSEGNFAWWMVERSEKQIEKIYLTLLDKYPLLIEQLWFNLHKKEKALQRSMALFSQTTLEHTLSCLLKQPIQNFAPVLAEIGLILDQTGVLNSGLYAPVQQLLGMALLGTIKQQKGKADRIGFLHMLLQEVAMQTSINYETILEKLHTYHADNERKSLSKQVTSTSVLQLRDLIATPPKFGYQDAKNQEKVLKKLDAIGNHTMPSYQLSAAIREIKIEIDKPGIRLLVKSWLKEKKNKEKLFNNLPDNLLTPFLRSVDPRIKASMGPSASRTLGQGGMMQQIPNLEDTNGVVNHILPVIEVIKSRLTQRIPLSNKFLDNLATMISRLLQVTEPQLNIDLIKNIFIKAAMVDPPATEKHYIARIAKHLKAYTPLAANLWDELADNAAESFDLLATKSTSSSLDKAHGLVAKTSLSDVVNFLLYNELPTDQLVPAYVIAKCLGQATPTQIRDELAPLLQEAVILKKLIQHATESILGKLLQAFIPFSGQVIERLEKVIIQSNLLQSTENQTNTRYIKEIFITAAIVHRPPTTEKQYIACLFMHLGVALSSSPLVLCDQLMDAAKQVTDNQLVEAFALLKKNLTPLHLDKLDEVDLIFLSTHEKFQLDKLLLPLYYNRLLPAIKAIVRQSDAADLSQSAIHQLVTDHLPTTSKSLKKTMSLSLSKEMSTSIQSKKERVAQRWHLFLHTGKLGNYPDSTALLNDVINQLPTFSLAQDKIHVRQRLIANFTHAQLILLVQSHSDVGQTLANSIKGIYQLWCATQGALGQHHSSKNVFWNSLFKTLPQSSIPTDDWLAQTTIALSNVLAIPPTTLVQTFQLLIQDAKEIPAVEQLTSSLNRLAAKYQQKIQQQAIESGCKDPLLTKLHLLLNGSLSLFSQNFHLSTHTFGKQLVQFMADQPLALLKFLEEQPNHPLVARRMVHYFSQEVSKEMITCLAQDNAPFVKYYLELFSHPLQHPTTQLPNLSTWQKELYISTIHYLITKSRFKEKEFIHSTLLTTCCPKEDIYQIIKSILTTRPATKQARKMITLLKPLITRIHTPTISSSTLAHNASEILPSKLAKEPSKKSCKPEEEIRVYTKNSGLVFLWPFLYDFFRSHNLMVGNQFVCEQAAHNGVYLLQYLVTGKLKNPEWQLTLPKLLCGLTYDEVLLPYKAIDEAYDLDDLDQAQQKQKEIEVIKDKSSKQPQQETIETIGEKEVIARNDIKAIEDNSKLLFDKVIKRWTSLKNLNETTLYQEATTQDILKNYFLNRLGILTRHYNNDATESKFWHLMIIHQDYDTVDLLPPWSMNNLKLPWMQEEIVLFYMA
ncbi:MULTISPECIES: contractile injection system tape measure protein [unclassified Candidatus Cardinium]|uniref:contractile injection system tape measure protein n=1 Tax=unclassified Candidatus Cardinium TaxID=2641185 RepID=UPI001FB2BACD|nr:MULTISPECIES: contractile injection system tape measure protein [unclassified Candidatus Cardinium]